MNGLLDRFAELTGIQIRLVQTVALLVVLLGVRWSILLVVRRQIDNVRTRYYWRKAVTYTVSGLGILLVARLWFEGVGSIATFLGLIGAGVAVALKDPLSNLAGWLFILWRSPFRVGDRVQIGSNAGDVVDLRLFQFTLNEIGNWVDADQSTGRLVHVPNGLVFTTPLANYTRGFNYIWNEVAVLVTFESNWKAAKQILLDIAIRHGEKFSTNAERDVLAASRQFMIFYSTLKPIVYTNVKDSGIMLTIRHLCEVRGRRGSVEAIWEDILDAFAKAPDIDLAYPTTRFYTNPVEGKPGLKPPEPSG
jgi:small-conductance mechanosensitive channel